MKAVIHQGLEGQGEKLESRPELNTPLRRTQTQSEKLAKALFTGHEGLKKKLFLNPFPQRNSCTHTQLHFSECGNTTDLVLSVFKSLNTRDICI